ncbi:MAG TPA: FtsX-like permease family protein [Dehalococcoidia bacterium]|nr:FtsX-like permease family protein [Dehalococcoidia bacterium]
MDALFGIPMNTIMLVLVGLLALSLSTVVIVFIRNRIIFLMGLRNIPRRMAQTVLIIIGLMLSTVIITAAFTTGDTVDYSITKQTYDLAQHTDIVLDGQVGMTGASDNENIAGAEYRRFLAEADQAQMEHVDGYTGVLAEPVPVVNTRTGLSEPSIAFVGVDSERMSGLEDVIEASSGDSLSLDDLRGGEVYMNESAADELDTKAGDVLTVYVQSQPHEYTVKAIVRDTLVGGATSFESPEGMVAPWSEVSELFDEDEVTIILISATGGVRDSLSSTPLAEGEVQQLIDDNRLRLEVSDTKTDFVDEAEEIGNFMTTFFLILGLFSIGAGMLLIVMIFVMLAAERKSEMGMARAVGTKRLHLVEMFLAEGTGYNLVSALVGVTLGVLVSFALTTAASAIFETFGFTFTPHVTLRTALISYSLGVVLTFATVTFSSWRISNLNIVAAIRGTEENVRQEAGATVNWRWLAISIPALAVPPLGLWLLCRRGLGLEWSWRWVLASIPMLIIPPLGLWFMLRNGFGIPSAWIMGWGFIVIGALFFWLGLDTDKAFPFALGFSLIGAGVARVMTMLGVPSRPAYTAMGLILLLFWGLTAGERLTWLFGTLDGDVEMFFLSGVAMVTASTFVLIYNSDIFMGAVSRFGGSFAPILPAVRTAVAYPMANRFRTGMTLAMISLVIFALTTMSAMNLNYDKLFLRDESRGGWDVQVMENPNNPFPTVREVLEEAGATAVAGEIRAEGAVLVAGFDSATEVRQGEDAGYDDYPVSGLTDDFIANASVPLEKIANGYEDAAAVWEALQTEPDAAITDSFVIQGGFGPGEFSLDGIPTEGDTYDAPTINVRDATSGMKKDVRVIGVISFGASSNFPGIYMGEDAFEGVFGKPELSTHFVALTDPDNSRDAARDIEATLATAGVQADSLQQIADENNALSRSFLYLMQAFMGLGLVVGIAAIGVIAFRTVVERRQQIGMLRAIGYKKRMVSLSFLLESSFVTVTGVATGTILGLWLAFFLVTSDSFPGDGNKFYVPWLEIIVISVLTIVASFFMTLIPSQQAASIPTAEALRYE